MFIVSTFEHFEYKKDLEVGKVYYFFFPVCFHLSSYSAHNFFEYLHLIFRQYDLDGSIFTSNPGSDMTHPWPILSIVLSWLLINGSGISMQSKLGRGFIQGFLLEPLRKYSFFLLLEWIKGWDGSLEASWWNYRRAFLRMELTPGKIAQKW